MMILASKKALASMMRKLKVTTTMKVLHSCKMTYYALSKKNGNIKKLDTTGQPVHGGCVLQP